MDAHRALELGDRRRRSLDIEQDVMALAVLFHAVGEIAQAPIFALLDLAALLRDQLGKAVGQSVHLRAGDVLARDKHILVKRHRNDPLRLIWPRSTTPVGPSRSSLSPGRQGSRAL